jgi:hypothetical protein
VNKTLLTGQNTHLKNKIKTLESRLKEAIEVIELSFGLLSNFHPFCEEKVPKGLDPTFYQTLSHKGDQELLDKYKRAREFMQKNKELIREVRGGE